MHKSSWSAHGCWFAVVVPFFVAHCRLLLCALQSWGALLAELEAPEKRAP